MPSGVAPLHTLRRNGLLICAGFCFVLLSGFPAFLLGRHLQISIDFYNWPYAYSSMFVALAGAFLLTDYLRAQHRTGVMSRAQWAPTVVLLALCVWALISVLWTVAPAITPDRAMKFTGVTAFTVPSRVP